MTTAHINYHVLPGGTLTGNLRVPGDKSISHRSVMLGALAEGVTRVTGLLEGEDVLSTLAAFRAMGVRAEGPQGGRLVIHGVGLHGLKAPQGELDMGNSGTAMRLMAGILAGQAFDSALTGDDSLRLRPMNRVAVPLASMGAVIHTADGGRPPLRIRGGQPLHGIDYVMPMASAQVKSSLLLAGLYATGQTRVTEPAPTRDHTERMLRGFGYAVRTDGPCISLSGGGRLTACDIDVPADISSATFFLVGAAIAPGSDITLQHVGVNPTRIGVLNILARMGAMVELQNRREVGGEPVADIRVRGGRLRGMVIPEDQVPLAIDEFPALFIAAACAEGETVLTGAEELRVKESDRIAVMATGLRALGIDARETPDGMVIQGGALQGGEVDSHGDHRIAMSFAMAALRASGPITVRDCRNVATSFPDFVALATTAGLGLRVGTGA
jgi:3-phosphoshikimate 1-carboxyvinyltransferase